MRPDRRGEAPRFGNLGGVRQWIEAIFDQLKDQLSLGRPGGHTVDGLCTRVAERLLALGAALWHNWRLWEAGELDAALRSLIAYQDALAGRSSQGREYGNSHWSRDPRTRPVVRPMRTSRGRRIVVAIPTARGRRACR